MGLDKNEKKELKVSLINLVIDFLQRWFTRREQKKYKK